MVTITVKANGMTHSYRVPEGATGASVLRDEDFRRQYGIPGNVAPIVDGRNDSGDERLREGSVLSFQSVASSKA